MELNDVQRKRLFALVISTCETPIAFSRWDDWVLKLGWRYDSSNPFDFKMTSTTYRHTVSVDIAYLPPTETVISALKAQGYIHNPPVEPVHLEHLYVDDLKELLREAELRVSGHKAMLIKRIIEEAPELADRVGKHKGILVATEKGKKFLADYLSFAEKERQAYSERVMTALAEKDFSRASAVMQDYASRQVAGTGGNFIIETNRIIQRRSSRIRRIAMTALAILLLAVIVAAFAQALAGGADSTDVNTEPRIGITCKDGSISFAENRQGACSGHGGIAE